MPGKSGYKLGVTSGLYTVARAEELSNSVKKLGYALTRGVSAIEIAADVPHEVTYTDGREIRYIAKKQKLDITFHGSLTMAMEMPERGEYRDAQDHLQKSIRSAVFAGAKYMNVHASLNIWLELMTYAGRKLTMVFCDHNGHFIKDMLRSNPMLRKWFIEKRGDEFMRDIFNRDERVKVQSRISLKEEQWRREHLTKRLRAFLMAEMPADELGRDEVIERIVGDALVRGVVPSLRPASLNSKLTSLMDQIREETAHQNTLIERDVVEEEMDRHLKDGRDWDSEELRTMTGIIDGYHIMAHHLFYTKDPMWVEMANSYKDVLARYKMDYGNTLWLDDAWKMAEAENDREFKEFFYAVCAAKFLEGHMMRIDAWIKDKLIGEELEALRRKAKTAEEKRDAEELMNAAKNIKITIEIPDARDPQHAGLYMLWHPKQTYAAIKVIRKKMASDRVWLLADFEHLATQGKDPVTEMEQVIKVAPDYGSYCLGIHANAPNPTHAHEPLELGDIRIYKLLWYLRQTGFGKGRMVYVFYERGGGQDPFQRSVDVLRLAIQCLEKNIEPSELPDEYFGMKGPVAGSEHRQRAIIMDHAFEPLKDLLEMPEEDWTFLSQSALRKGKRPEQWKRGEFR